MRTSLLICATCILVTGGCSAQFRLPSLSSALSSLTGFGGSSSNSNGAQSGQSSLSSASSVSSSSSSPYSGLVRDYGRNLMMAMSSIYPTLFKPPQSQSQQPPQQQQQQQQAAPSPFEQFGASQQSQSLFGNGGGGQSGPSFSFGGSTFSISPSFPFGSLTGANGGSSQQQAMGSAPSGSHSPFSASFGSSINSPPSFGALSNSPFLSQSMPSFAPASSYNAAFEAANGSPGSGQQMFGMSQQPSGLNSQGLPSGAIMSQSSQASPINSYPSMSNVGSFSGQHDSSGQILAQPSHHQPQLTAPLGGQPPSGLGMHQQGPYGSGSQQAQQAPHMGLQQQQQQPQYVNSQQYRPDMMSIAASAPVPSSSQYSNYGSVPVQQGTPQSSSSSMVSSSGVGVGSGSSSSYQQQPSYR